MEDTMTLAEFWSAIAATDWNQSIHRTLVHWMGIRPDSDVLDVACGSGSFALRTAQRAETVLGLDEDETLIERAREAAADYRTQNVRFDLDSLTRFPYAHARFDFVTCIHRLFLHKTPELVLREMLRVVKPAGEIIIVHPSATLTAWQAQVYSEQEGLRAFDRDSLLAFAAVVLEQRKSAVPWLDLSGLVQKCGGMVTERTELPGGLLDVWRVQVRRIRALK